MKLQLLESKMNGWYNDYRTMFPGPKMEELVRNGEYVAYIPIGKQWRR
jgi:hypothetical protein